MPQRPLQRVTAWCALAWIAPAALYAGDAGAWGLYTHVYFGQLLIWAAPLLDRRFRHALQRFPALCLAGTCLPDISLFSRIVRVPELGATHQWSSVAAMLQGAETDEHRAIAVGYASHLLTDIVAHNYFVPAHERLWVRAHMLTHAAAEWAMDAQMSPRLFDRPDELIARHFDPLSCYAEKCLGLPRHSAVRALKYVQRGEKVLRTSGVPNLVYAAARRLDPGFSARCDEYIRETSARLRQINQLIAGETPAWLPEPDVPELSSYPAEETPGPYTLLLPRNWFPDEHKH